MLGRGPPTADPVNLGSAERRQARSALAAEEGRKMRRDQRRLTPVAMVLCLGLAGPALAIDPSQLPPGPAQAPPVRPQRDKRLIRPAQKPDLACTLSASNPNVSPPQPITDGATVNMPEKVDYNASQTPDVWFPLTVKNIGKGSVDKSFVWTLQIKRNNEGKLSEHTITPPVAAGESKVDVIHMAQVPTGSTTWELTVNVDSKNQIDESNKKNNQCKITITTVRKGPQPQVTFASLYPIYSHQRCVNCHGAVNQPFGNNHGGGTNPNCTSCHTNPPGWKNTGAPSFVGKSAAALCVLAKSPGHLNSNLTQWAFAESVDDPNKVPLPAKAPQNNIPGGHAAFVQKWNAWAAAGKPCS